MPPHELPQHQEAQKEDELEEDEDEEETKKQQQQQKLQPWRRQRPRPDPAPNAQVPRSPAASSSFLDHCYSQSQCSGSVSDFPREVVIARHLVTPFGSPRDVHTADLSRDSPQLDAAYPHDAFSGHCDDWPTHGHSGSIFSTSHQRVGGEVVRDVYRFVEDRADGSTRKRSKSHGDVDNFADGHGRFTSSVNKSAIDAENPAVTPSSGRSPPPASTAMPDIAVPGGFRRHFVQTRASARGQSRSFVTKDFLDFLSLYGHFAGGYLEDEDDEAAESGVHIPFPDPCLPPFPPRPLSERSPLLPSGGNPACGEHSGGTASARKVVFLLLKSFIGTGVLFLPRAFFNGGLLFSSIFLFLISALCLYGMLLLLECHTILQRSFGDIGGTLFGPRMRQTVLVSIVMSQLGFCCAYFIFVAQNASDLVGSLSDCRIRIPQYYFIAFQLLLYIPVSMIRKIKSLGFLALVADCFILLGLGYLFAYDIQELANFGMAPVKNFNTANFSLFIGTAVFTFEGIGLVLPIADSMKDASEFPRVLTVTMLFVTILFTCVGALSYATFGDDVKTVILLNLPSNVLLVRVVQALYSFAIVFSVPLQMYPAVRIMEAGLWVRTGKASIAVKWQKNMFRIAVCVGCAVVAYGGASSLDRFTALIGAFACVPLSFIYPALFHYKAVARSRPQKTCDIALFTFGVVCMVYVTSQTIEGWVAGEIEKPFDPCAQRGMYAN